MSGKTAIKSIVLTMLILLSFWQIERLWFENNSSHSFFYSIPRKTAAEQALQELILEPDHIALYRGETKGEYYAVDSAGIVFGSLVKDVGRVIRQLAQMTPLKEYPYENLFDKPHILYHFSMPISEAVVSRIAQVAPAAEAGEISTMALVPAGLAENNLLLLFFDENTELVKGFSILKSSLSDENEVFFAYISNPSAAGGTLLLSAKQRGLTAFQGEALLPAQNQNYILPQEWRREPAFLTEVSGQQKIDVEKLSDYIFFYIKNPRILWNIQEEERVRFGDSSVLTQYDPKGIFTYRFVQQVDQAQAELSAGEALKRAFEFMRRDHLLSSQEFKLADYRQEGEQHIFRFDYYFRGHRLVWKEEMTEYYGATTPMEIIVEREQVVFYRRLLLQAEELLQQGVRFQVNYEEVLNRFYQTHDKAVVKSLALAYFVEGEAIRLGWAVKTSEGEWIYSLNGEEGNDELE